MKTSELTGTALNWAVAKAKGVALLDPYNNEWELCWTLLADNSGDYYAPSTNWAQGGPIIERERIELCSYSNDGVDTAFRHMGDERGNYSHHEEYVVSVPEVVTWTAWVKYGSYKMDGPTPLIAAMRCYVASKLGDNVELPEGLV